MVLCMLLIPTLIPTLFTRNSFQFPSPIQELDSTAHLTMHWTAAVDPTWAVMIPKKKHMADHSSATQLIQNTILMGEPSIFRTWKQKMANAKTPQTMTDCPPFT